MVSSFHCPSPDQQLGPSNQITSLKSEQLGSHPLKLVQSLRRGSVPRHGDILAVKNVWFILVSSFLLWLACTRFCYAHAKLKSSFINEFFFPGWALQSCQAELLDCPHPSSALKGFLRGFSCNACGIPQGSQLIPDTLPITEGLPAERTASQNKLVPWDVPAQSQPKPSSTQMSTTRLGWPCAHLLWFLYYFKVWLPSDVSANV